MALIKKIDVNDYFAARRRMRVAGAQLVKQAAVIGPSEPKATGAKANASGFEKDFSLEHSALKLPAAPSK